MQPLVIKEWKANSQPVDPEGNLISITGRQGGLIAWILALLKIDPTTSIKVSPDRVQFSSASLSGTEFRMIPILSVCSTYYGYHKPWKAALGIAVFFGFIGAVISDVMQSAAPAIILLLMGIGLAFLYYFLSRTLTLGFVEHSGVISGIRFKRSIIEGVEINQTQGNYICGLTQSLIEAKRRQD